MSVTGAITNNIRFPGQYYDEETGLHYNYFRDYNPAIGRYIEADPIGIDRGKNHLYGYVGNNSVNFVDPMGLWGPWWFQPDIPYYKLIFRDKDEERIRLPFEDTQLPPCNSCNEGERIKGPRVFKHSFNNKTKTTHPVTPGYDYTTKIVTTHYALIYEYNFKCLRGRWIQGYPTKALGKHPYLIETIIEYYEEIIPWGPPTIS